MAGPISAQVAGWGPACRHDSKLGAAIFYLLLGLVGLVIQPLKREARQFQGFLFAVIYDHNPDKFFFPHGSLVCVYCQRFRSIPPTLNPPRVSTWVFLLADGNFLRRWQPQTGSSGHRCVKGGPPMKVPWAQGTSCRSASTHGCCWETF